MLRSLVALCALLLLIPTFALAEVFFGEPPEEWLYADKLRWTVFDVNEADAMLLECGGESMLIDGGSSLTSDRMREDLDELGMRHLTYMLNTHGHDDDVDGLYHLLQDGFTANEYLHSYSIEASMQNERVARAVTAAQTAGIPVRQVSNGDVLTLGGALIQVIQCTTYDEVNARSLVLRVDFGASSILLCADITGKVQRELIAQWPRELLRADLIKIPHHGITSAVPRFLSVVAPKAAVVTSRKEQANSEARNQLQVRRIPAMYSGDGRVMAETNGVDWYVWQGENEGPDQKEDVAKRLAAEKKKNQE